MSNGTKLGHYIRERKIWLIFLICMAMIYLAVAGVYGYDGVVSNMLYAAGISFFFIFVGCCFDFLDYRGRCRKLEDALAGGGQGDYRLPVPKGRMEQLYHELLCEAMQERSRLVSELDGKQADMADYYTMWIHQVKTPIAALHLLQQRMEDEGDAAGKENRRQSAEELFKIEQYAEMALHYARLDSMSADLLLKTYDIGVIIRRAVRKYAVLFIGSGLNFSMEEFACTAVTDEKWLGFVVEQLLANALKYTKEGGIRIYGADGRGKLCGGTVWNVVIEDTGIGIRAEDLPRIFERGFTGYNGRMERKSTGIGLYLCRSIMERLGHTVRVESKEGEGTKFILGFEQRKE